MTEKTDIRTRPDGSIDTAHYMARGRMLRSRQAHRLMGLDPAEPRCEARRGGWLSRLTL